VYVMDWFVYVMDWFVYVMDWFVYVMDWFVYVMDWFVYVMDCFVYVMDWFVYVMDWFVYVMDWFVYVMDWFVYVMDSNVLKWEFIYCILIDTIKNTEKNLVNYVRFFGMCKNTNYFQRIKLIKDVYSSTKIYRFRRVSKVAKSDYWLEHIWPSFRPSAWTNSALTGQIFM
jgi:hypothetical protein